MSRTPTSAELLALDPVATVEALASALRHAVRAVLHKRGVVVGLSGGIDSSVAAALSARALGSDRVLGLLMPEAESSADSTELGRAVANALGIEVVLEEITPILEAAGCYRRRDEAIRGVIPEYDASWAIKLVLPSVLASDAYRLTSLVAEAPDGRRLKVRLPPAAYQAIVAATNTKQRTRKMLEYYHADRLNYAVVGTPNRLEYDQGFFVKNGDGAADVKPIAHLYKSQVYALADHLGIPERIRRRAPTTDTFSLPQSQEEFYFSLPYDLMDLCLFAFEHGMPAAEAGAATGLSELQVERVYRDIASKRRAARYLHMPPVLLGPVEGDHQPPSA